MNRDVAFAIVIAAFLGFGAVLNAQAKGGQAAPVPNGEPSYAGSGLDSFGGFIPHTGSPELHVLTGEFYPASYMPANALVEFEDRDAGIFRITRDVPIFTISGTVLLKHSPAAAHSALVRFMRRDTRETIFEMMLYVEDFDTGTVLLTVPLYLYDVQPTEIVFVVVVYQDYDSGNGVMVNLKFSP